MKSTFSYIFLSFCLLNSHAQTVLKDSVLSAFLIELNYGYFFPAADLADRFGNCSAVGPAMKFKVKKNFVIGVEGNFLFGRNVKENDLLNAIITQSGNMIGNEGTFEDFTFSQRGFHIKAEIGKIIPFKKPNINSGLYVALGLGAMQHKIHFDVDVGLVPQLNETYQKGYDRLTNGFALSQFIGYRYFTNYKFLNFFAGVEIIQGFTKNRRSWNFDTNAPDNQNRIDVLMGLKAGLVIPIFFKQTEKYYYY